MALNLGSLSKPRQSFSGGNRGTENVAVMVGEVHVHDKSKRTPNPAEDYAICYLLEDAFGMKAEFNFGVPEDDPQYGLPTTSVKVKMRDVEVRGEFTQPGIFDLQVGKRKGAGMPMGEFPIIVLESAYLDSRTDTVTARWYRVGQRKLDHTTERCHTQSLVSVDREGYDVRDGERKYHQARYLMMADSAAVFSGLDHFKEIAKAHLTENPDLAGGRPSTMIRIIDIEAAAAGKFDENVIATTHVYTGWSKEEERPLTPEESVERFLADPKNKLWVEYIEASASDEYKGRFVFELIPSWRYSTGRDSLPSVSGKKDDAESFRIPAVDRATGAPVAKNNGDGFVMTSGFAMGSMILKRANDTDAPWFATNTFRKQRFGPIFMRYEVVTPNLPEAVRNAFESRAEARGNAARQEWQNSRSGHASDAADDEIPFGVPDHSGGLTPT